MGGAAAENVAIDETTKITAAMTASLPLKRWKVGIRVGTVT